MTGPQRMSAVGAPIAGLAGGYAGYKSVSPETMMAWESAGMTSRAYVNQAASNSWQYLSSFRIEVTPYNSNVLYSNPSPFRIVRRSASTPQKSHPNSIYEQTTADGAQLVRRSYYDDRGSLFSREDYLQTSPHRVVIDGTRYNLKNQPHQHELRTLIAPDGTMYSKWQVRIIDHSGRPLSGWANSGAD